jgi:polyhydroxyalkanoate synthesis regulator phasin
MIGCSVHTHFFDENCIECKKEYREMKGIGQSTLSNEKATRVHSNVEKYKEFSEERAKKLYEELLVQYLKSGRNEIEAAERAKSIIRKQCSMRGISLWNWV